MPYCMDEDDELALKLINTKLPAGQSPISEDYFEEVMNFFEETAQARQPFAAVDSPPVLPLEELQEHFDDTHPEHVRTLSKFIYSHWSARRTEAGNHVLPPHLKFETGQESDDSDPYVCFRRRELRQIRKTRNRDAQSAEKLRKLRLELETARNVLLMVKRREQMRKDALELERQVFEQRLSFRDTKRKLGIKGDEDLLINQKKQKLPPGMSPNQAALAQQLRMPLGAGGASEMRTLSDVTADKQRGIDNEILINIDKHLRWNEGYVDKTRYPLTPDSDSGFDDRPGQFREAMPATEYLPTPPASNEDDQQNDETADVEMKEVSRSSTPFRYASPVEDDSSITFPSFRRRVGRGGRVVIDRKFPFPRQVPKLEDDDDRWKYDSDHSDDDDSRETSENLSFAHMALRAHLYTSGRSQSQDVQKRAQVEASQHSNQPTQQSVQPAGVS